MPSLKEIDIRFARVGSGLVASSHILSQVESLTHRDISLSVSDMRILVRQFPSLKSFFLLDFKLSYSESLETEKFEKNFIEKNAAKKSAACSESAVSGCVLQTMLFPAKRDSN